MCVCMYLHHIGVRRACFLNPDDFDKYENLVDKNTDVCSIWEDKKSLPQQIWTKNRRMKDQGVEYFLRVNNENRLYQVNK